MYLFRQFFKLFSFFLMLNATLTHASVTMQGNRIIYSSGQSNVDVRLTNNDDVPYVIQSWFDSGDPKSTPQTGKAPFTVIPPIFRIEPQSGQTARIIFTGQTQSLPQDRESIFFFNFLQIPPISAKSEEDAKNTNQLVLLLKNRVKVFYRPQQLPQPLQLVEKLDIHWVKESASSDYQLQVKNNNPWFTSIVNVQIEQNQQHVELKKSVMIAPFAATTMHFPSNKIDSHQQATITVSLINDQGGVVQHAYPISFSAHE